MNCRYHFYVVHIDTGHSQLLQGMAQAPPVQVSRLVILQEPRPARGIGWMTDRERREDRDPDGIRDLIAPEEPPVTAADRKRGDDSEQCAEYHSEQGENDPAFGRTPWSHSSRCLSTCADTEPNA